MGILARPLTYREEIVGPIMTRIQAGESCSIVGVAGTGKSNLFQFVAQDDVRERYLGESWKTYLLVLIDSHSLRELSEWAIFELLLHSVLEYVQGQHLSEESLARFEHRYEEVVRSQNPLLAQRYFELAIHTLCREHAYRVALLCDQFDEIWAGAPGRLFANLRGVRDRYKYQLCYIVGTRDELSRTRENIDEVEDFWELVALNVLGLRPFSDPDAAWIIRHWAERVGVPWAGRDTERLIKAAGTHPSILRAAFFVARDGEADLTGTRAVEDLLNSPRVWAECQKVWDSIGPDEQAALQLLASGSAGEQLPMEAMRPLQLKGLVNSSNGRASIFCRLFAEFVSREAGSPGAGIKINRELRTIWVDGRVIGNLTPLEFNLLDFLFQNQGRICSRDELIAHLYPGEHQQPGADMFDNRIDAVIARLRQKIELDPGRPQHIQTRRGMGFILPGEPQ
jgi:hypothetical protein